MIRLIVSAALLAASTSAMAGENCTCRYQGAEISEGQTACIRTPNGLKMAKCERVLNNTSWKFLDQPCPSANLQNQEKDMTIFNPEAITALPNSG